MCREDIAQVNEIDHEAFPTLLPPANYKRELSNPVAHYIVACDEEKEVEEPDVKSMPETRRSGFVSRVKRLFNYDHFGGNGPSQSSGGYVIGFAGIWRVTDEVHITNIAVRKAYHRQGIGELLLVGLIDLAVKLNARIITLEVRASNIAAQALYSKYGFTQVGLRRCYYIDNREDGVLMSTENIASSAFQSRLRQLKKAHSLRDVITLHESVR
ncbi:ribosomal protein S18-alanine N-acetyltransferase [Chloroflexota bacterium]